MTNAQICDGVPHQDKTAKRTRDKITPISYHLFKVQLTTVDVDEVRHMNDEVTKHDIDTV